MRKELGLDGRWPGDSFMASPGCRPDRGESVYQKGAEENTGLFPVPAWLVAWCHGAGRTLVPVPYGVARGSPVLLHIFVVVDPTTLEVRRWSKLMTFTGEPVEYSCGFVVQEDRLLVGFSVMDRSSSLLSVPIDAIQFM